jgi:TNF receptor-associated factor 6
MQGFNPDVSKHIADNHVQHFKDIAKAVQKLQEQQPVTSNVTRSAGPSTSHEEPPPPERPVERIPMSVQQSLLPMRSDDAQRLLDKITKLEERVIELEGRVSAGTFIWKIEEFRYCRSQAIDQTVPAIHSPPFYTSLYGYKMCLRMNLNGVDSGFGHHISLFVHMMQGDWDDILEWPFTGRITLAILDQSEDVEFRRPISETLVAKPNLLAFQKPTTSRNHKGYGYVEFCQIDQLRDDKFVKNNSMLVRIQVFH